MPAPSFETSALHISIMMGSPAIDGERIQRIVYLKVRMEPIVGVEILEAVKETPHLQATRANEAITLL